jgi:hypothetical protein
MSEQLELFPQEELQQEVNIPEAQPLKDAEWCFQFFNNEPIVFAWSNEGETPAPLTLQLEPNDGEGLNFHFALPLQSITAMTPGQIDVSVTVDESPLGLISFWMSDASGEVH